ncbi:MAG: cytochrome c biogenesis heme-transporting ATPase CcmA [Proteobacteria bacterium]|nr:cytochrome c biogenesis heme-transporting ATPase CcmA [Pseudomonadota bacterium]
MTAELRADNLHLWRGEQHVLRGVGFVVSAGQCLLVTGRNGAGKTSLIRTVAGLLQPEEGRVFWRGEPTGVDRSRFHSETYYLGHDAPLKGDLTGAENLRFGVGIRRRFLPDELRAALARTAASDFADRPVRTLSAGQRRRIALAGVLLTTATLWLLDEPTTNLDASGQELIKTLIEAHLAAGGIAIAAIHHPLELDARATTRLELA